MEYTEVSKKIAKDFSRLYESDATLSKLYAKARDGTATYTEANEFAIRVSELLSSAFSSNLGSESMENLTYDDALSLISETLESSNRVISSYASKIQDALNEKAGMKFKALVPDPNKARIRGIANSVRWESNEAFRSKLDEAFIENSLHVIDDLIEANASFHKELGYEAKLIRTYEGAHREHTNHKDGGNMADCEYCMGLAGTYDYAETKKGGGSTDVYKRHPGCRCTIEYVPSASFTQKMKANAKW